MSSFVVDKSEFVKAAGLMYGIERAKRDSHLYFLENVRKEFVKAYELNVASVNEQYHDDCMPDGASYDTLFEEYKKKGEDVYNSTIFGRDDLRKVRNGLFTFFRSVLYQIENEEMSKEVSSFFFDCLSKLYEREYRSVDGWWGEIEC